MIFLAFQTSKMEFFAKTVNGLKQMWTVDTDF